MSDHPTVPETALTMPFGDGKYRFHLGLKQIGELQTKCDVGLGALMARVMQGRYLLNGEGFGDPLQAAWYVRDLTETIFQGLVGGGEGERHDGEKVTVGPIEAQRLLQAYVYDRPLAEAWSYAAAIIGARVEGYTGGPPQDPKPQAPTKTDGSTTPGP